MARVIKWVGYLLTLASPLVTNAVTAKAGPAVGAGVGGFFGTVGARLLHLSDPPAKK